MQVGEFAELTRKVVPPAKAGYWITRVVPTQSPVSVVEGVAE